MLGAVARGDGARLLRLAEALLLEPDRERADGADAQLVHEGHDGARVETAREEHAERDVAHQVALHRCAQRLHQLVLPLGLAPPLVGTHVPTERPVAARLGRAARLRDHHVSRRELRDAGEDRRRARHVAEGQVVVQRLDVELRIEAAGQEALRLRAPDEPIAQPRHVERLDPDTVACQHEATRFGVPQREREHAVELGRDVDALLLVEVGDHLDVGAGA